MKVRASRSSGLKSLPLTTNPNFQRDSRNASAIHQGTQRLHFNRKDKKDRQNIFLSWSWLKHASFMIFTCVLDPQGDCTPSFGTDCLELEQPFSMQVGRFSRKGVASHLLCIICCWSTFVESTLANSVHWESVCANGLNGANVKKSYS